MPIAITARCFLKLYSGEVSGFSSSFAGEEKSDVAAVMLPDNLLASFKRKFPASLVKEGKKA